MIALAAFCFACVFWFWRRSTCILYSPPVVPGGWALLGHAPALIGDSRNLWNVLNDLATGSYNMGGVVTVHIGPQTVYIVTDPDDLCTVAKACIEKDDTYEFSKPWIGDGLITSKVSIWKNHRKLLNPAFNQSVLDTFMGVLNSQSRKLVESLDKEVSKGPFDHWTYIKYNTLETVCLTSIGVDFSDPMLNSKQYIEALAQMYDTLAERFMKFWLHSPYTFRFSGVKRKQDACLKILHNVSNTVLQRKISEFKSNPCAAQSVKPGIKFKAFMDLLLELSIEHGVLNDKEIRDHVDTMIAVGEASTGDTIMFTLLLLGSHPEVQEKVFHELYEVLGEKDRDIEKQDLSQLVYLEAVIKESMRIYTVVPVMARKLDRDVKLKNYTLLSGHRCFLFLFGLHRHPIWGPDRHLFKPERWLDPSQLPENPNAYAPFSVGRRGCIGKGIALTLIKITLAHLLRRYIFSADDSELELKLDVLLKPVSGYYVSIERRTYPEVKLSKTSLAH